ncbi:PP0621 family protein [Noviherbaspirillum galbum]|uniref:Preprotein translocase subunit YajC n=1 Tax=Noviherbaspirillum galbum TaxID=2709383 RepID=A0A6B3SZQ9_9BURK|nr:PP0621 family protein [Noviherbaspirillum galbum]NEX64429.1 hypothetical protein [Noviherbaspirillum galbum]
MKFALWALFILLIIWMMRGKKAVPGRRAAPGANAIESMVQCRHCGVHVPVSESVAGPGGACFCSDEHRLRHAG